MNGGDSLFSFIRRPEQHEETLRQPLPDAPAAVPKPDEALYARVAGLEARLKKLEESGAASSVASESARTEAQAAARRSDAAAGELAALAGKLDEYAKESRQPQAALMSLIGRLREELDSCEARTASLEEKTGTLDLSGLNSVSINVSLLEGRLKNLEEGLCKELNERFSALGAGLGEASRRAGMAAEAAAGGTRRLEKIEERISKLPYLEGRVRAGEERFERIYDLEALAQSLRQSVESMQNTFSDVNREFTSASAERVRMNSDFDSLSRQVRQLTALFNQFRAELAFLMPGRKETAGG